MKYTPTTFPAVTEPRDELIRDYAYHLFVQSGQIPGRDLDNWLEAKACIHANVPMHRSHVRLQRRLDETPARKPAKFSPSVDAGKAAA